MPRRQCAPISRQGTEGTLTQVSWNAARAPVTECEEDTSGTHLRSYLMEQTKVQVVSHCTKPRETQGLHLSAEKHQARLTESLGGLSTNCIDEKTWKDSFEWKGEKDRPF